MAEYVALDVSLKETSVCIVTDTGSVVFEGRCPSDPGALVRLIRARTSDISRVGLETGPTSGWLYHQLTAAGLPVVCRDARHAHAALSVRPSKSDRNDARGLADMLRMGWYREVQVKSQDAQQHRALLVARHRLAAMRRELDNQIRGLLKPVGVIVGCGNSGVFAQRAQTLVAGHPVLADLVERLLEARRSVLVQVSALDKRIGSLVRTDPTCRRLLTVPGVGPVTALAFVSTIDDPHRFRHARDVGPYLGLTPRRYQSGELDRSGRISKCGDRFTRTCLYEAASVLLSKVQRWSPLKAWGQRLAQRLGAKKAKVAIARKLAVILHCIWVDGTEFWWSKEAAMS